MGVTCFTRAVANSSRSPTLDSFIITASPPSTIHAPVMFVGSLCAGMVIKLAISLSHWNETASDACIKLSEESTPADDVADDDVEFDNEDEERKYLENLHEMWTIDDFMSLKSETQRLLMIVRIFPRIIENTFASYGQDIPALPSQVFAETRPCVSCATTDTKEFLLFLPQCMKSVYSGEACVACTIKQEAVAVSSALQRMKMVWPYNKYAASIPLLTAATTAYRSMADQASVVQLPDTRNNDIYEMLSMEDENYIHTMASISI